MAKQNNDDFLGGGLKFNQAGVGSEPKAGESVPVTNSKAQAASILKTAIAIVCLLLLAGILFFVNDFRFGGVAHTSGNHHAPREGRPNPQSDSDSQFKLGQ